MRHAAGDLVERNRLRVLVGPCHLNRLGSKLLRLDLSDDEVPLAVIAAVTGQRLGADFKRLRRRIFSSGVAAVP